eukprot:1920085-Alexandrium_andersonii.AAC.1
MDLGSAGDRPHHGAHQDAHPLADDAPIPSAAFGAGHPAIPGEVHGRRLAAAFQDERLAHAGGSLRPRTGVKRPAPGSFCSAACRRSLPEAPPGRVRLAAA